MEFLIFARLSKPWRSRGVFLVFEIMDISYLGHSSFRIKTKTANIVTDPFDPKMVGLKFSGVEADIVTISHHHEDHGKAELVKGVKKIVDGPGEYEIMGVSIIGFASFHDDKKGAERGANTIYVFEADSLRLAHLGDLGHVLTQELIESMGDIDILMIPVGGVFTIGPQEAVAIVREIEPKIVIPMHYQVPHLNPDTFSKLLGVEQFLKEVGLQTENLPKLSINKEEFGEGSKAVVLEIKA